MGSQRTWNCFWDRLRKQASRLTMRGTGHPKQFTLSIHRVLPLTYQYKLLKGFIVSSSLCYRRPHGVFKCKITPLKELQPHYRTSDCFSQPQSRTVSVACCRLRLLWLFFFFFYTLPQQDPFCRHRLSKTCLPYILRDLTLDIFQLNKQHSVPATRTLFISKLNRRNGISLHFKQWNVIHADPIPKLSCNQHNRVGAYSVS